MKSLKMRTPVRPQFPTSGAQSDQRIYRTQVAVGDVIQFAPTGEELRVKKIDRGRITFEKLP